jgi:ethanolamine ammonia-lyase large subunit
VGTPLLAPNGRVKLAEAVSEALQSELVISLIGERPGGDGMASRSMSAYLAFRVGDDAGSGRNTRPRFEYTVISNIYEQGAPPEAAARMIAEKVRQILAHRAAGNRLESLLQGDK